MSFFQVKKLKKQTNNKMMYIKNTLNKKNERGMAYSFTKPIKKLGSHVRLVKEV